MYLFNLTVIRLMFKYYNSPLKPIYNCLQKLVEMFTITFYTKDYTQPKLY